MKKPEYTLKDYNKLVCPNCHRKVGPKHLIDKSTAFYRCVCGASWRVDYKGDMTHFRVHKMWAI